jgi:regulator of nucleoside diphosphate kinase
MRSLLARHMAGKGDCSQEKRMERQSREQGNYHMPEIVVGNSDHARLTTLANAALDRVPDTAEELLSELDRAKVVADDSVPRNVVRMGSTVEYRSDNDRKRVTLVFPQEADISSGKISVLTPVGTALIGLAEGESITWTARDGSSHELTIISVEQPGQSRD